MSVQAHAPAASYLPLPYFIGVWVGPKAGLDALKGRKKSSLYREAKRGSCVVQASRGSSVVPACVALSYIYYATLVRNEWKSLIIFGFRFFGM